MGETAAAKRAEESITPFKFGSLLDQMDDIFNALARRAYQIFEENGRMFGQDLEHWFQAERELLHPAHVSMLESDGALEVRVEVPGFSEKELEVSIEPRRLKIAGKREAKKEEKKGKTVYAERCCDQILRIIDLPVEIETDKVSASLKNGILELTLPKSAKVRSIRIHPKAA